MSRRGRDLKDRLLTRDEIAAQWRVRMADPGLSASQSAQFERWLGESTENAAAYEAIQHAWNAAGAEAASAEMRELREQALRYSVPTRKSNFRRWAWAAGLGVVALTAVFVARQSFLARDGAILVGARDAALFGLLPEPRANEFQTGVGQRSAVRLVDGSVITLNTASRIETTFSAGKRIVRLLSGQAMFEVARDVQRPFTVFAGDRRISVLGTSFDVRVGPREVRVTLVDGRVAVDQIAPVPFARLEGLSNEATHPKHAIRSISNLEPGEELVALSGGSATIRGTDVRRVTSWRDGRLIFQGDRLSDAISEMNRYSQTPIVLADPSIGDLQISGVFRTGQPEEFAHALSQYFPLEATRQSGTVLLIWAR